MSELAKNTLEIGTNGAGEVVISHPDLKPDENGVGHIVFSPDQAMHLASLLQQGDIAAQKEADQKRRLDAESIPVDRSAQSLTDGSAVPEDRSHTILRSDGQQEAYVVLRPEERAKGADYVLDNSGDRAALKAEVARLWEWLTTQSA